MKMLITREQFEDFESIQQVGVVNMAHSQSVACLSVWINKEEAKYIRENYTELKKEFS